VLGLGTWAFGGGSYWGPQDQGDVDDVVSQALEAGITYFDTAEMYNAGASEESLGRALRGRRDRAIVGSKISPNHTEPAALRAHCEASLRRLGTDYLDLYMVHWPINANALRHYTDDPALLAHPPSTREAFLTLDALRKEGKIRHIGVSNFGVVQLREVLALGVPVAVNELPYNLFMRAIEHELAPFCREQGIGIIGYMALMQGVLAGEFETFDELPEMRTRTRHFSSTRPNSRHGEAGLEAELLAALQALRLIAHNEQTPLADLAIAWTLANPDVACVLAGCRNRRQLEENARAASLRLRPDLLAALTEATEEVRARLGDSVDYFQGATDSRIW
jgi:aryl-alcohol dehydrogenase-like predicted oxidoreductase